jgi:hypothetical protein
MNDGDGFVVLILVGCVWLATFLFNDVSVEPKEMEIAVNKCLTNDGLDKLSKDLYGTHTVVCKNDAKFVYEYKEESRDGN